MKTTGIRKQLQEYIDKGDEKLLRLMYALANAELELHKEYIQCQVSSRQSGRYANLYCDIISIVIKKNN